MSARAPEAGETASLAERIDRLLPQTQCTRCGYPSCRDYAHALAAGEVEANRCPPGGTPTVRALASLLGRKPKPLDPACGGERPWVVARIVEAECIGCTLCIQVCPVDAILGASKRMHTVIEDECTGCELCPAACPVDCIALVPMREAPSDDDAGDFLERWMRERAPLARRRFASRQARLHRPRAGAGGRRLESGRLPGRDASRATKQAIIRAAVDRASRRHRRGPI